MLYELQVLETWRIADLALDVRKIGDVLLEKVPEAGLGEPTPGCAYAIPMRALH
jgi:hypothetical protein